MKIDVEGFGLKLLRGATEMILKSRPIIYIEPHENEGEVKEWMADKEYAIEELGYPWLCTPLD